MIILDTNVLSEVLNPKPSERVITWLSAQPPGTVCLTTVTQAEMLYGLALLPAGRRRDRLTAAIDQVFLEFEDRILSFDQQAARTFGKLMALRQAAGKPISQFDGMIVAVAHSRSFAVATRNTRDFEGCGVRLINPWEQD
jgi:predicted nucleic acid-binding protein